MPPLPGGGELLAASAAIFVGSALQGAVGFGLALVAAPVLFLIDERLVPGPILITSLLLTALTARRDWHAIDFPGLKWGLWGRIPGTVLGAALLWALPAEEMAAPLAALVMLAVAMSASGIRIDPTPRNLVGAGLLSGVMGTTSSIGGPPLAMVYQHAAGDRIRGTLGVYFVIGSVMSLAAVAAIGRLGLFELIYGAALVPAVLLGFVLSTRFTAWIDGGYTRPAVLVVSAAGAIAVFARQFW
jgi:uncharacterized membrane protein YfcA